MSEKKKKPPEKKEAALARSSAAEYLTFIAAGAFSYPKISDNCRGW